MQTNNCSNLFSIQRIIQSSRFYTLVKKLGWSDLIWLFHCIFAILEFKKILKRYRVRNPIYGQKMKNRVLLLYKNLINEDRQLKLYQIIKWKILYKMMFLNLLSMHFKSIKIKFNKLLSGIRIQCEYFLNTDVLTHPSKHMRIYN